MTINKISYISLIMFCLLFYSLNGRAETKLRSYVKIKHDIGKQLSGSIEIQGRLKNNFQQYDRAIIEPALYWKFNNNWRMSFVYRYQVKTDATMQYEAAQRASIFMRYRNFLNDFTFKARSGMQYGVANDLYFFDFRNKLVLRNAFEVQYHVFGTRLYPYLGFELFSHLNHAYGAKNIQCRSTIGSDFQLNKQLKLNIAYLFENEFNTDAPKDSHIIQMGVSYEL